VESVLAYTVGFNALRPVPNDRDAQVLFGTG